MVDLIPKSPTSSKRPGLEMVQLYWDGGQGVIFDLKLLQLFLMLMSEADSKVRNERSQTC